MKVCANRLACVAFLLLFVAVSPTLFGSRYSPPSHRCRAILASYMGGIEEFDMDSKIPFHTLHGSKELDVSRLFEKGILKQEWEIPKGCRYYLLDLGPGKSYELICRVHGLRKPSPDKTTSSPHEQFLAVCRENGLDPATYSFDLSREMAEDIMGPRWLITVANVWWLGVAGFSFLYFFVARPRLAGAGWAAHLYAFGASLIAGLFVLSALNILYVGQAVPMWRRFTYGSYPAGLQTLSQFSIIAFPLWWIISFIAIGLFYRDRCSLRVPLVYILIAPVALILGEIGHFLPFSLLTPLFGVYLCFAMRNFEKLQEPKP